MLFSGDLFIFGGIIKQDTPESGMKNIGGKNHLKVAGLMGSLNLLFKCNSISFSDIIVFWSCLSIT